MDLSIIIVSYNTEKILLKCIDSIKKYTKDVNFEVIIVDNNSSDNTHDSIKRYKGIENLKIIVNKDNKGYASANNQGLKISKGRYILLLNSDTYLLENTFLKMINFMDTNLNIDVATCTLLNTDKSIQPTGGSFPTLLNLFFWGTFIDDLPFFSKIFGSYHPHKEYFTQSHEQDWITGAFFLLRKEVVDKVGFMDGQIFMYGEDVEYCYRIKSYGFKVFYTNISKIIHIGGASGVSKNTILGEYKGIIYFYKKYFPMHKTIIANIILKFSALLRMKLYLLTGNLDKVKIYAQVLTIN